MTGLLLVRHASVDGLGRTLMGRAPGRRLSGRGVDEARAVSSLLATAPVAAVHTSPLERARESAEPIADAHGLVPRIDGAFHEVDFGDWTGLGFDELGPREDWRLWNHERARARPPGGESMAEVLDRALEGVRRIEADYPDGWVVIVSHGDVIRPLLAHFLGLPLEHQLRFELSPASISAAELHGGEARVLAVNRGPVPPWPHRA